ncbi:MAG: hypothetical protein DRP79_04750 [Planctomycetota bacterium]|nr:MAG: hypothetical protein DRP79_04750 [Planctomycetota bacterium]
MATGKPNPIAKNIEIILAIAGFLVFLLVLIISIIRVPSVSLEEISNLTTEYHNWLKEKQGEYVDVPEPVNLAEEHERLTVKPARLQELRGWCFNPYPVIVLPKSKEDAFFIGAARLTAEPGYNRVKLTVRLEDLDKRITRISALSKSEAMYPHLPPEKIKVEIYRGEKRPGAGEIRWEEKPSTARPSGEEGVFVLEDRRDINGVTELYYKADVSATVPFLNAEKLGTQEAGPELVPEEVPPKAALTNTDEEVLKVVTKSPWSVKVSPTWGGRKVTLTVVDLATGKKTPLQPLGPGEKIGDTTFRLINIIQTKRFVITTSGTISRIELEMAVWNRRTGGAFQDVGESKRDGKGKILVWTEDPLNPIGDNKRIIEKFTKYALEELAAVSGGLDLGGATFDYDDNFITNLLWRAVRTYPGGKGKKMKDAFGRVVKRYQYQPAPDKEPIKLIPYPFTEEINNDESLVLQIDPHGINQNRVSYFAEYSKRAGGVEENYTSGPYKVDITGYNPTAEDKVEELIRVIRSDVMEKHEKGVFARNTRPGLVSLGDAITYGRGPVISLLSKDDLGMDILVLVQYRDEHITEDPKLLEAPVTVKSKYVKPTVEPAPRGAEAEFKKKLYRNIVMSDKNPRYENIGDFVEKVKTDFDVEIVVDRSVKSIEGLDGIDFSVRLDDDNVQLSDLMPKAVDAFNDRLRVLDKEITKTVRYEIRDTDILLTTE